MKDTKLNIIANTLKTSFILLRKKKPISEYLKISFDYLILNGDKSAFYMYEEIFARDIYNFKSDKKEFTIIDVGSNVGYSIRYFKEKYPESKIIGYEPLFTTFNKLKKNVSNLKNVEINQLAVTYSSGVAQFNYCLDCSGSNSLFFSPIEDLNHCINVKTIDAGEIINERVELLKLDCEGGEYDIIQRLVDTNKLSLINQIIVEIHFYNNNLAFYTLNNNLIKNGFSLNNVLECSKDAVTMHFVRG